MGDDSDRISSLPDAILYHILSFLPTKESVSTSVLSKRWNPLWRSVPTFHFELDDICFYDSDDSDFYDTNNEMDLLLVQSVYAFLLSRDFKQPLQTFRLRCFTISCDYFNIKQWLNFATTQGRVEHLDLDFNRLFSLPSFALACKTLVVLKLKRLMLKDLSSVDLPNLKVLQLISVGFVGDAFLAQLLSGCPNLEDLETEFLAFSSVGKFRRLPKLVRANIHGDIIPLEIVNNVQFLSIYLMENGELNFEFPNLTHLELGYLTFPIEWIEVLKILKNTPRLRTLVMQQLPTYVIIKEEEGVWPYLESVPECITSHLKTCFLKGCVAGSKPEFQFARYILQNARYLQSLTISFDDRASQEERHEMVKGLSLLSKCSETCILSFA